MKKTNRKHLLQTIKKTSVSFFAVAFIAAVSIAIFQGFQSASKAILDEVDRYFVKNNLVTMEIACANGITDDDIAAIAGWDGVQSVEGGYAVPLLLKNGEERISVQTRSLQTTMNTPVVLEGELPDAPNEMAIEELVAVRKGLKVGDTIVMEHDGELVESEFTITAIINQPSFCLVNLEDARGKGSVGLGSNEFYVSLPLSAFDPSYFNDCFTTAYVDSSALDGVYYFSEEYQTQEAAYLAGLDVAAQERAQLRYESLVAEAESKLSDARNELADAQTEIDTNQADLDAALADIATGEADIESAEAEIAENETKLVDAKAEIEDAEAEIAANETKLADAKAEIESAEVEIAENETKLADAKAEIEAGQAEIDANEAALIEGETAFAAAKTEFTAQQTALAAARTEIDGQLTAMNLSTDLTEALTALEGMGEQAAPLVAAITEYQVGEEQLVAAETQLNTTEAQLTASRQQLDDAKAQLATAKTEADAGEKELTAAKAELVEAKAEVTDGEAELADAKTQLADAKAEVAEGEAELADAKTQLADAKTELTDAQAEVADGEQKLADARVELAEGQQELTDAEADVAEIQPREWVLSGRNDVGDVRGVQTLVDMLDGLSYIMSLIFLLVSIIICYAAVARMIDEQRTLIGAQKALGFSSNEILRHYMLYSLLCALLGIVLGWSLSVVIVENLILNAFKGEFLLDGVALTFSFGSAVIAALICLMIFMVSTYASCAKLSRMPAIVLLRGEVPTYGKKRFFENWGAYKRLNLYSRTMIKNVINDKGRMLTTIMGVVGCVALLVSCMTMKMSMENASIRHFDDYFHYTHRLVIDSEIGDAQAFEDVLNEEGVDHILIHDKLENFRVEGGIWENAHLLAIDNVENLGEFMLLEDPKTRSEIAVPDDGVLVSLRCAERFGLSEGSTVEFMDDKGQVRTFRIAGVIEHYLNYHLFVTSPSYYAEAMGKESAPSVFLLKGDLTGLLERVSGMDGFLSMNDNSAFEASADMFNIVIYVCTALSAALALLVLLNQINMHINRKARELAVMRINGYTCRETKAYIYKDNIVLTVLGLLLGSLFGMALGYLDVRIIETGACRYVRDPNLGACAIVCGIVAVFALGVNLLALRRVKHLNLTNVSSN